MKMGVKLDLDIKLRQQICAIKGVCAWPNLQLLPNGELLTTVFNQPCHGLQEGELDCYSSNDNGEKWYLKSRPCTHEKQTIRMNCAAGIADNKVLICCGGWSIRDRKRQYRLSPWMCFSDDQGREWEVIKHPGGLSDHPFTPFGNIVADADGHLCMSVYLSECEKKYSSFLIRSRDGGKTWQKPVPINPEGDETTLLHLSGGEWLAASREDNRLALFRSVDNGANWRHEQELTLPGQVTGHLIRLNSGEIMLTYGNRNTNNCGIDVRISDNRGGTWSAPGRIASLPRPDCGYPSTVQLADDSMVTVYYSQTDDRDRYVMYARKWNMA